MKEDGEKEGQWVCKQPDSRNNSSDFDNTKEVEAEQQQVFAEAARRISVSGNSCLPANRGLPRVLPVLLFCGECRLKLNLVELWASGSHKSSSFINSWLGPLDFPAPVEFEHIHICDSLTFLTFPPSIH